MINNNKIKRSLIMDKNRELIQGVKENLSKIADQGFSVIQLSPLQQHKEKDNPTWYLSYQITNYKIGNRLGIKTELKELCDLAHTYGIKIIVDVVFNHVGNNGGGNQELIPSVEVEDEIRLRPDFFHEPHLVIDYDNRYECTQFGIGLPDLNTSNHELQDLHIKYMKELLSVGCDGFRLDAVRHIELPDDPYCGSDYWSRVLGSINDIDKLFIYGECIYSSDELIKRYSKYMKVGVNTNTSLNPKDTVRWSLSHDDHLTFNTCNHKDSNIFLNEWEHVLKHYPNTHMLFYPCPEDNTWALPRMKYINNTYR
jgi:alpha-amylase